MLLRLSKLLSINLTEKHSLIGVILLIDTGFARYVFVSSIIETAETAEQCMKSVQSTANKKITSI